MSAEEWRFIPGSDVAQASDAGNVRTLRKGAWHPVPLYLNRRTNYLQANVRFRSGPKTKPVHRLVGETFLGPRPEHLETRHLNGDRFDNRLTNLAYGTHSENMLDQVRTGTHYGAAKSECSNGHDLSDARRTKDGYRVCRECSLQTSRRSAARKRQARIDAGWDPTEYDRDRTAYWAARGGQNPRIQAECKWGHPLSGPNLRIAVPNGQRICRTCEYRRAQEYKARRRGVILTITEAAA